MKYQVFSDMDGVLVNFEDGVLRFMNQRLRELKDQPDHPDHKLARSAAKEIGGWDVEIDKWHIARSDQEGSLKRNYRTRDFMYRLVENDVDLWVTSAGNVVAKNFGIILKIFQVLRFCRLPWLRDQRSASGCGLSENWVSQLKKSIFRIARSLMESGKENKDF